MIKRKIVNLFILIVMLCCIWKMPNLYAEEAQTIVAEGVCGENITWTLTEEGTFTISGTGEMSEVTWNEYKNQIKTVIITEGITSIADKAFYKYGYLENVSIAKGVTRIGESAFHDCGRIRKIVLPDGVTTIGEHAFADVEAIITAPNSITEIGSFGFWSSGNKQVILCEEGSFAYEYANTYTSTKSIVHNEIKTGKWGNNIRWSWDETGTLTLEGTGEMSDELSYEEFNYPVFRVVVKDGITSISKYAFQYCRELESVQLPKGIKTIGSCAFYGCGSICEIALYEGLENIEGCAFYGCSKLEQIEIPKGVTRLGNEAFYGCRSLKSITVPKSVESIEMECFRYCVSLEDVTISEGIDSVGRRAFADCSSLKTVTVLDAKTEFEKDIFENASEKLTIQCLKDSKAQVYAIENNIEYRTIDYENVSDDVTEYFTDVQSFDWFAEYIQYVYDKGLMRGIDGTYEFRPTEALLKSQVAQILYNMEGKPEITDRRAYTELVDVESWAWYADAVCWAYNEGIITGDLNTKEFKPYAMIHREQIALMLYRYTLYKGYPADQTSDFSGLRNVDRISNWAEEGLRWAVGAEIISGKQLVYPDVTVYDLAPDWDATRAEMAAMMTRYCGIYDKE